MDFSKLCKLHNIFDKGSSHVLAAVQTLLHVPPFVEILLNDDDHRKSCKSLMNCFCCALFRIVKSAENSCSDVSFFISKWKFISANMLETQKQSPFQVLSSLICKFRLEIVQRKKDWTSEDLHRGAVGEIFKLKTSKLVSCRLCGDYNLVTYSLFTHVDQLNSEAIEGRLLQQEEIMCNSCPSHVLATPKDVELPGYFLVHCKIHKYFNDVQLHMKVFGVQLQVKAVMVKYQTKSVSFSVCADGHFRKTENNKTARQTFGQLMTSTWMQGAEEVSVLYERLLVSSPVQKAATPLPPHRKVKVISSPEIEGVDLYSNLPESPKTRTVGTQTNRSVTSTSAQTDPQEPKKKSKGDKVPLISYEMCKTHKLFQFFTGLSVQDFEAFHEFLGGEEAIRFMKLYYQIGTPVKILESKVSSRDRLFMFLLRLRRGLPLEELGVCFGITDGYAGELCYVMTRHVYLTFKELEPRLFISAAAQNKRKPLVMRPFKNLRVILDGASFFIENPSNFQMQGNNYSDYKGHTVMLFSIGISCNGSTIFCSQGFEGHASDKEVLLQSEFLMDILQEGDAVMVDRGYNVTAELIKKGVRVIKPPSKSEDGFNEAQETYTKAVAAARIYIEHAIADVKDNRLLQGVIPLSMYPVLPQLVFIAAYMRNFSTKIIGSTVVVLDNEDQKKEKKNNGDQKKEKKNTGGGAAK